MIYKDKVCKYFFKRIFCDGRGWLTKMPSGFFIDVAECDPGYKNVRDKPHYYKAKNFVESLWEIYKPYADKNFQNDAVMHFQERFWEMYLGATFLEHGFTINRGGDKGPEFYLSNAIKKIWIEAVTPSPGKGPDAYELPKTAGSSPAAFTVATLNKTGGEHIPPNPVSQREDTDQKNVTMRSNDFLKRSDTVRSIPFRSLAPNPGFVAISLSRFS